MAMPPHWPQVGIGRATIQGYAQAAGLPTSPQEVLALMPIDVQGKIQAGISTYGNFAPAISVAQTISSGGVPTEASVIAGVSSAASVISPLAGAAMGVSGAIILGAESLMQSFFDLLGLYDHPRAVKCCGLRVASSIPYGPSDPMWLHIQTLGDLHNAEFHISGLSAGEVCDYGSPDDLNAAGILDELLQRAVWIVSALQAGTPQAPTAFDKYYATLLRSDLENWANCNPFIQPRQLLMATQLAWNQTHQSSSTFTYQPVDRGEIWYSDPHTTLPGMVLGNAGDPTGANNRAPPLVVNTGALVADASGAPASPHVLALHIASGTSQKTTTTTATKVAAGTAVVTGAAVVGTVAYSFVKGQAVDVVLKGAWRTMRGWFR